MNYNQVTDAEDQYGTAHKSFQEIVDKVIENGQSMKSHWSGEAQQFFEQNSMKWQQEAGRLDQALGAQTGVLGDQKYNTMRTDQSVVQTYS